MDSSLPSLKSKAILERAEEHCAELGGKLTKKRRQVLSGLLESPKALSAYELTDFCNSKEKHGLLPMSVYRILEFLEAQNLAHRLRLTNKYVACSHITCDHDHELPQFLICNNCDRVEEIGVQKALFNSLVGTAKTAGFDLVSNQIELEVRCENCLDAGAMKR
jgi:Fur family zinc uptake transcriptional regulator